MRPKAYVIALVLLLIVGGLTAYYLRPQPAIAPEISGFAADWPLPNRDYSNTRSTNDSTINLQNVKTLELAWSFPITGVSQWGAAATNPIIQGKSIYLQDLKSNVYVVDLDSGQLRWKKEYNMDAYGPNGPGVSRNKVFIVKGHYEVAALDMQGREIWSTRLSDQDFVGIDIQPIEYHGLIYVSTVPGTENANFYTGGGSGIIYALDQETGKIKWSFNTVDSQDIWGKPTVNSGGGAWFSPAIDLSNGTMYWPIGNPAPWPGTPEFPNGTSRPGPNLYTDSLLAIDHNEGKMLWYQQFIPHDLFDYDLELPPILATIGEGEKKQDIIIAAGKMGKVYGLDRTTGRIIWETPVGRHENDQLKELPQGTTRVYPGPLGGVETPMAYKDGVVYVPVLNVFADYTPAGLVSSTFDIGAGNGELVALNAADGNVLWKQATPSVNVGAATVVNDLVFTSTMDGTIYAYDRISGTEQWKYQAPGGINGWPAVAGNTIIFPIGMGEKPALLAFKIP